MKKFEITLQQLNYYKPEIMEILKPIMEDASEYVSASGNLCYRTIAPLSYFHLIAERLKLNVKCINSYQYEAESILFSIEWVEHDFIIAIKDIEKITKNEKRKDQYGNYLFSDIAFIIGYKALKKYVEDSLQFYTLESLKRSNVFLGYCENVIMEAIEKEGLNPNYDGTYTDYNEIIGSYFGESVDMMEYESNALKGWKGTKYTGYKPAML